MLLALLSSFVPAGDLSSVRFPLRFEENAGQTDERALFVARAGGHTLFLTREGAVLRLVRRASPDDERCTALVRLRFVGASPESVRGEGELAGGSNYYVGDPPRWREDVRAFERVRWSGIRPGVDLVFHGRERALEFDCELAPGADPASIAIAVEGGDALALEDGELRIATACGPVTLRAPKAWQGSGGERRAVDVRYRVAGSAVGFELGGYDPREPLVIDPEVTYLDGWELDGSGSDFIWGVAVNQPTPSFPARVYVTGFTDSADFPDLNPIAGGDTLAGGTDAFIARLDPGLCCVLYATYVGGSADDVGLAVATDGPVYVTGSTTSLDFPIVDPFGTIGSGATYGGGSSDAFVIKLEPAGMVVEYSRYLGGNGLDGGRGIAVFTQEPCITGVTTSTDFPLVNPLACASCPSGCLAPFDGSSYGGGSADAFVTKVGVQAELDFSTYLGGTSSESGYGIAELASDPSLVELFVTGWTSSAGFPVTCTALDPVFGGGLTDAFLVKLELVTPPSQSSTGTIVYSTFLGGSGADAHPVSDWVAAAVAVDGSGGAYVAFPTDSTDLPTPGAIQPANAGGQADAWIAKLDPAGAPLVYATYLGGTDEDDPIAIDVDLAGSAHVAGFTRSADFPLASPVVGGAAFDGGGTDAFALKLDPSGASLVYSTYLGGPDQDFARGVAADFDGSTFVGGYTSPDLPPGPASPFLAKISAPNTPAGTDVCVKPWDPPSETGPVEVTFAEVTTAGDTMLIAGPAGPPPPVGFAFCIPPVYYDVLTTAEYAGAIEVCIDYTGTCTDPDEANLKLFHFELGTWVDVTTSVDTPNDVICGSVTSLSPFLVLHDTRVNLYCFGDGSGTPCPCDNSGAAFKGCANSGVPSGAQCLATSFAPNGAGGGTAVLQATGLPPLGTPTVLAIRSVVPVSSGAAFGDGLLCLGGTVVRLGATLASGGSGSVPVNHGAGAGTFHYQLWYRNNPPFCTPSQFNLTNGIAILWP